MFPKLVTGLWKATIYQDGLKPKEVSIKFTDSEIPAVLDLIAEYKEVLTDQGFDIINEGITWE